MAAMVLVGCRGGRGGKTSAAPSGTSAAPSGQTTNPGPSPTTGGGTTTGAPQPTATSVAPTPGSAHAVPWNFTAESMFNEGSSGYAAYEGDHDVSGTNVNFHDVMINDNPAGDSHTASTRQCVFQFSGPKSRDPGIMTISKVAAFSSVEVKVLIEKSHTWSATQIGAVSMGGTNLTVPGTSTSVVSDYDANWNLHTVNISSSVTTEGDFVINNTNKFAFYIVSLNFQA